MATNHILYGEHVIVIIGLSLLSVWRGRGYGEILVSTYNPGTLHLLHKITRLMHTRTHSLIANPQAPPLQTKDMGTRLMECMDSNIGHTCPQF